MTTVLPSRRALHGRRASRHAFGLAAVAISLLAVFQVSGEERAENAPTGPPPALIELVQGGAPPDTRNLLPGQSFVQQFDVRNVSWTTVRYSLSYATRRLVGRDNLARGLQVEMRLEGSGCRPFDGPLLAHGPLPVVTMGNRAPGAQAGDRVLDAGQSESICVRVTMDPQGTDELQRAAVIAKIEPTAEAVGDR
jgi:hypothetical protein